MGMGRGKAREAEDSFPNAKPAMRLDHKCGCGIYGPSCFINSSLDQFIASVRVVLDRFPFDSGDTEERDDRDQPASIKANGDELADEWDKAADELTEALRGIDSAAVADLDGFWMTFVADVQMGNYATKVVLTAPEE